MDFTGFTQEDFDTFRIEGLERRMDAIRRRIQPEFQALGTRLANYLTEQLEQEMFLHIARHARRSVHPPQDTWLAIAANKRGYKKHPHFQVGLFDDHVFIWLALIYELPDKEKVANAYLEKIESFHRLPAAFSFSQDHTKKDAGPVSALTTAHLERFRDIKKAELLIGRKISAANPVLQDEQAFPILVEETFAALIPYYRLAVSSLSQ